ncbi:MAG: Rrf2 family transcriptional regulator [Planctomycetes bacterium]|nr:Rrf2 family transcriptional regulator [Planctomycetota bacterium]
MRLPRSGACALRAAMEMALAGPDPVTVAEVARRHAIPPTALAKVFQRLVRAGIAVGHRGVGGGYRLSRDPSAITVLEVIEVFEPIHPREPGGGAAGEGLVERRLRALLGEVDETVRCTFASVTLATLVREPGEPGERVA